MARSETLRRPPRAEGETFAGIGDDEAIPPPIFVGGTTRSGTTITGRLLGAHPRYAIIPFEAQFHCYPRGLVGIIDGNLKPRKFERIMREEWFESPKRRRGLSSLVDAETFDIALRRFFDRLPDDPVAAGRMLVRDIFVDYARWCGKESWVEMTPSNPKRGATLFKMFPEMRMVHTIRDGRDVAASLVSRNWSPDVPSALALWEQRLTYAYEGSRDLPDTTLYLSRFDDLAAYDRDAALQRLCDFLDWGEVPEVREFHDRRMPVDKANVGSWSRLSADDRDYLDREYPRALDRLRAAGVPVPEAGQRID